MFARAAVSTRICCRLDGRPEAAAGPAGAAGMTAAVVLACRGPAEVAKAEAMPGARPPAVTARAAATTRAVRLILLVSMDSFLSAGLGGGHSYRNRVIREVPQAPEFPGSCGTGNSAWLWLDDGRGHGKCQVRRRHGFE